MTAMTMDQFDADFGAQNFQMAAPGNDGIRELSFDEIDTVFAASGASCSEYFGALGLAGFIVLSASVVGGSLPGAAIGAAIIGLAALGEHFVCS